MTDREPAIAARAADWRSRNDHSNRFGQCEYVELINGEAVRCERLGCLHRERDIFGHERVRHLCQEHGDQCIFSGSPSWFQPGGAS